MSNGAAPPNPAAAVLALDPTAPSSGTAYESASRTAAPAGLIIAVPTWLILAGAAKSKGTTTVLRVSPNITAAANTIAQDVLPSEVLILPVHSDSAAIVYSVGVHFAA